MNDPQVLVTSYKNSTGEWIDLTECSDQEAFADLVMSTLGLDVEYTISDSADLPKCFIKNGKLEPEAFEFAQMLEVDRTTVFAYSTVSTDTAQFIVRNALTVWRCTTGSREEFAQSFVANQGYNIPLIVRDCIDFERLVKKLAEDYDFVDIASKTYVFHK